MNIRLIEQWMDIDDGKLDRSKDGKYDELDEGKYYDVAEGFQVKVKEAKCREII